MRFQERIEAHKAGACALYTLRTRVDGVVNWRGSFRANPAYGRADDLLMHLAVGLLDKGTRKRDRFAIADVLENRGAQLGFSSSGVHIGFWGRALRDDVPVVLDAMAEQLRKPLFDADEFEKARLRMMASIRRSLEDTTYRASAALTAHLYPKRHPNFTLSPEDELDVLSGIGRADVVEFYDRHFGANELTMVMVGDLDEAAARKAVKKGLGSWKEHDTAPRFAGRALKGVKGGRRFDVSMPDRMNLDVAMGHALRIRRDDDAYAALFTANHILGGNFSSRLMDVVRDNMGLTYGIYAALTGVTTDYDGHWKVGVTLSQENLEKGIAATRAEVARFVEEGPSQTELDEKITTIVGAFNVRLATTGGLARAILRGLRNGYGTAYLDEWPARVASLTLKEVRKAARAHFKPERLDTVVAGTMPAQSKPAKKRAKKRA